MALFVDLVYFKDKPNLQCGYCKCSPALWLIKVLVLLGVLIGPSSAFSAEFSGIWSGNYSCSSQARVATLTIVDEETARFDFKPGKDAKPVPAGTYTMGIWRKGD